MSHKHTPRRLSGLLATRLHRHPLFWGCSINYSICVGFAPSKCYCKCCSVWVWVCTCVWRWLISCDVYSFRNATLQPPVSYGLWKSLPCLCLHDNQKPHTTTVLLNHLWGLIILIWLFQVWDWGTEGLGEGRQSLCDDSAILSATLWRRNNNWIKVALLKQTWAAQLAVRGISTWINCHNYNSKIYVTLYYI